MVKLNEWHKIFFSKFTFWIFIFDVMSAVPAYHGEDQHPEEPGPHRDEAHPLHGLLGGPCPLVHGQGGGECLQQHVVE